MRYLFFLSLLICSAVYSQELEIVTCPDTVYINSNVPCWPTQIEFKNNSPNGMLAAVYDTASAQLIGTDQIVGFNGCSSPLPGQPDQQLIEPQDTLPAMFVYYPNNQTGITVVDVCFFNWSNPGDTVCSTIVIISDLMASQKELDGFEMDIYPNPSNGLFSISGIEIFSDESVLLVANSEGRIIYTDILQSSVDLGNVENGHYYLFIKDGNKTYHHTLIISN
ncbi:MAG: T9SS type A sorting domain-containing protein [Crocinitomicaceae bacterium]